MTDQNKRGKKPYKKAFKGGESLAAVPDKFAHIEAVQAKPLEVKIYGGNFDRAIKAFRALVQKERVLSTYKEKQSYEKPSDKKRRKRNEAMRKRSELANKEKRHKDFKKENHAKH